MTLLFETHRSGWLLFVHIAAAFLFFGGAITVAAAKMAAARARAVPELAVLARLAHRVDLLVIWPALVILVGAGAQLASDEDAYGQTWLRWGIVLTAIVAVITGLVQTMLDRRRAQLAERLLAGGGEGTPGELERLNRSPILTFVGTLSLVLLVVVFWLMTAKPGVLG